jgi:hypothetical protein
MKIYDIRFLIVSISLTILFSSLINYTYAFHENLGIDDNKALELYQTKPNDPAIVRWKNAVQSAISDMDKNKCFDIDSAISCQSLIPTIISNCKSHPNTLLACRRVLLTYNELSNEEKTRKPYIL